MDAPGARDEGPLAALLDALPERVARYRLDDLTVLYCNAAKAATYGLTPATLVGRSLAEVAPAEEAEALRARLATLVSGQVRVGDPDLRPAPDAPGRWIEWVDQLVDGPDGPEVLSVGRDVTARQRVEARLREVEQRFEIAMGDAPIGMAIVSLDGTLLAVNQALCAFVGRREDELLGMTTLDITHADDVEDDLAYGAQVVEGADAQTLQKRYLRPDGTVVWGLLQVSVVRDEDDQPLYEIGQVVDITEQVEREQALRRAAEAEHTAAERLRDLDEVKNAFLSAVSHELRTPLTVIRGMADTLRRLRDRGLADGERDRLEDAIVAHARRLGVLLDDLLDVDRLVRGRLRSDPEAVDAAEVVRRAVADRPTNGRVHLQAPATLRASVDPVQLERIVVNLLDNAAKYGEGADVEVSLAPLAGGGVRLDVADDGPGIPADQLDAVFEPFHRGEVDHPSPGTGVGLALVAAFASVHGGRAWAEDVDRGTHVVVELPDVPADGGPDLPAATGRSWLAGDPVDGRVDRRG